MSKTRELKLTLTPKGGQVIVECDNGISPVGEVYPLDTNLQLRLETLLNNQSRILSRAILEDKRAAAAAH